MLCTELSFLRKYGASWASPIYNFIMVKDYYFPKYNSSHSSRFARPGEIHLGAAVQPAYTTMFVPCATNKNRDRHGRQYKLNSFLSYAYYTVV